MKNKVIKKTVIVFGSILLLTPLFVFSSEYSERKSFFIEPDFDYEERRRVDVQMIKNVGEMYFYAENDWWRGLPEERARNYRKVMREMGDDFWKGAYPWITKNFGKMPQNGVVGTEEKLIVLFHPMRDGAGGYFRTGDQYSIYQYPRSGEANILYLNANLIEDRNISGYLAHEYVHLVTFNQKNRNFGINEEIWLNELRAELIMTILGYDDLFEKSNLQSRKNIFLRDPDISLTEWTERIYDYGVVNIFGQYILDHYGEELLTESLKIDVTGIPSIDYALSVGGFDKRFSQIFTDWTIAVFLNDCSVGERYCFKNKNLQDLKVSPSTIFIPADGETFSASYQTKNWSGNWHKITGERGTLRVDFYGQEIFTVPYVMCPLVGTCDVSFLEIDEGGRGVIEIENFNQRYASLTIIPSLQQKYRNFNGPEETFSFTWKATIEGEKEKSKRDIRKEDIRNRINTLKRKVEELYRILKGDIAEAQISDKKIKENLYFGTRNSKEVEKLQLFLKNQGKEIYPEGLVTGNYFNLTQSAVIRFQEKYKEEFLLPQGILSPKGYVGEHTRRFINSML